MLAASRDTGADGAGSTYDFARRRRGRRCAVLAASRYVDAVDVVRAMVQIRDNRYRTG